MAKHWIQNAIKKPNALHRSLGIKAGNKIPPGTLFNAAKKGGVIGKRARLAETLKGFKHKKISKNDNDADDKMKSKSMKCKTCGKSHSKGVKHKFDMMGGIKSFFSPKPATAQRVNTSIGNKIPGAGGYMQHSNDLKTALNWKKKGKHAKR